MERFARQVLGYHGCRKDVAALLLNSSIQISEWERSDNLYDWLGHGIYFWEHSPWRAERWAKERFNADFAVVGAVIQLGACFDLMNEEFTGLLPGTYENMVNKFAAAGMTLVKNKGKARYLDCLVINDCLTQLESGGTTYDTVRGAFLEGDDAYPGAGFSRETHIQIAVRNPDCILGVFRPNLKI